MRTRKEILIAKLFDNPIGRKYLGVPKGKKIFKITKSSAHYYTGELSKRNGMPVICTGDCRPDGKLAFWEWLENWKPIHLCWLFIRRGWKIPKYFIGADTGFKSPSATGDDHNQYTNPTNAFSSNDVYAVATTAGWQQDWYNFSFGISAEATIDGFIVSLEGKDDNVGDGVQQGVDLSADGGTTYPDSTWQWATGTSENIQTVGGATQLFSHGSWTQSGTTNANFRLRLTIDAMRDASNVSIDHVQVKVFYTESVTTTSTSSTTSSSTTTTSTSSSTTTTSSSTTTTSSSTTSTSSSTTSTSSSSTTTTSTSSSTTTTSTSSSTTTTSTSSSTTTTSTSSTTTTSSSTTTTSTSSTTTISTSSSTTTTSTSSTTSSTTSSSTITTSTSSTTTTTTSSSTTTTSTSSSTTTTSSSTTTTSTSTTTSSTTSTSTTVTQFSGLTFVKQQDKIKTTREH